MGRRLITAALATVISADRERVWRALVEPEEIVRWDERRTALVDRDTAYPSPGARVRWRSKLGTVALVLTETPGAITRPARLAATCRAGSLRYEELFVLREEPGDEAQPPRTHVSLKLSTGNRLQLIGADVDRFEVRRMLIERIDVTLRALQKWCEA